MAIRPAMWNALANSCVTTSIVMLEEVLEEQNQLVQIRRDNRIEAGRRLVEHEDLGI
jgi:hypothetical protein